MPKTSNGEGSDYLSPESSVEKAAGAMAGMQLAHRNPGIKTHPSLYPFWANPTGIKGQRRLLKLFIPASRTTEQDGESDEYIWRDQQKISSNIQYSYSDLYMRLLRVKELVTYLKLHS